MNGEPGHAANRFSAVTRVAGALATILSVLLLLVGIDGLELQARLQHFPLAVSTHPAGSADQQGETWVIVGSDSRADIPVGSTESSFGSPAEVGGARADIVLIVHRAPSGRVLTVSVPRDLLVHNRSGQLSRLALTFEVSPQDLVDSLCATLHVPTDHLIVVDFAAFSSVVDELRGIIVDVPTPLRDPFSGLDLPVAGSQRLNGVQALALVRSRHAAHYTDGRWLTVVDGASSRTSWGGVVFSAIVTAVSRSANPLLLQRLAWTVSGSTQTDQRTSLTDLAVLAEAGGQVTDLPVRAGNGGLAVTAFAATYTTLATVGFGRTCG